MKTQSARSRTKRCVLLSIAFISAFGVGNALSNEVADITFYDEAAYTEYVENMMTELDQLYIEFTEAQGKDAATAFQTRKAFLTKAHDLMHSMNARYDKMDPKAGAALSPTETLVNMHALIMLIDILSETQLDELTKHPYIE
jgi:hypothetical protein